MPDASPSPPNPPHHVAFLSSLSRHLTDRRLQLYAACEGKLWVAEGQRPDLVSFPPLEIVDVLIEALQRSEIFICLLAGDCRAGLHPDGGTPIHADGEASLVSYFEIEVFQAALSRVPAVFLRLPDFQPGPRLEGFLRVLRNSAAAPVWIDYSTEPNLEAEVLALLARRQEIAANCRESVQIAAADLATRLVGTRGNLGAARRGRPDLLWLQGDNIDEAGAVDVDSIQKFLAAAEAEKHHDRRLTRTYIALRGLMAAPYRQCRELDVLQLWNRAFGIWSGSAAWRGMHNHLALGTVSALWSQDFVRARLRKLTARSPAAEFLPPHGSLASTYYSLAKVCRTQWHRWRVAEAGIRLATMQIKGVPRDSGALIVRGCLHLCLYNVPFAFKDFFKALRRAEQEGGNPAEPLTYLGALLTRVGCYRPAQYYLDRGLRIWEAEYAHGRGREFYLKALKHAAELELRRKRLDEAEARCAKALWVAGDDVSDQIRQIEEIRGRIAQARQR